MNKIYKTKVNSRKHIHCQVRNDKTGYNFWINRLVDVQNLDAYLESNFKLVYLRNKVAIVRGTFGFDADSINIFYNFAFKLDKCTVIE